MMYKVQVNRKVRNIRVYNVLRKSGARENALTKLFERVFVKKKPEEGEGK
jgi:hypothetical protein